MRKRRNAAWIHSLDVAVKVFDETSHNKIEFKVTNEPA